MIKLSLTTAILIYIFVFVVAFLIWWAYVELKKSYNLRLVNRDRLWQCSICTYIYSSNSSDEMTVCPRCGSYNEKGVKS